jgi:hypothetical protein
MVGVNRQVDSNTARLTSASGVSVDWECAPPLQNVSIVTPNNDVIEEQKNKHLQEQLADFNCVQYRTLLVNSSRGKNILRTLKKVSLAPTDQINQQAVTSYVWKAIWPGNKMLPKKWSKYGNDKRTFCQMILKELHYLGCGWKVILGGNATRIHK